jgi:glycosyltransferase involved in cell wall biosynthesis
MVSVWIPTKNEELNLPACLDCLRWCDDIHVYDSGSIDRTVEIARAASAIVTIRNAGASGQLFGGDEAEHRNWAFRNIPFRYPWVLHIDADERVTPELLESIRTAVLQPEECVAFEVQRRDFLSGTWLRHVQATPYYLRLFRPNQMRFERRINPVSIPSGLVGRLAGYLDHYPFSKGVHHWIDRHNSYSTLEAEQIMENHRKGSRLSISKALFSRQFVERRYHQKELFYRLPFRPLSKFFLLYVAKRGFLDGGAGLTYAALQAFYEFMIVVKTRELSKNASIGVGASPLVKTTGAA